MSKDDLLQEINQYEKKILELKGQIKAHENSKSEVLAWVRQNELRLDQFSTKAKQIQFDLDEKRHDIEEKQKELKKDRESFQLNLEQLEIAKASLEKARKESVDAKVGADTSRRALEAAQRLLDGKKDALIILQGKVDEGISFIKSHIESVKKFGSL